MIRCISCIFFVLIILLIGCSEKKDVKKDMDEIGKTQSQAITLKSGIEAILKEESALWSNSALKVLNSANWSDAKPITRLNGQSKVFVLDVGKEYSKIKTATYVEGWIVNDQLIPTIGNEDSIKYFGKKKFGQINTYVDGMDVKVVKLWDDMEERSVITDNCYNGDKVVILSEKDDYVLLRTISGKEGWCMKGFIK